MTSKLQITLPKRIAEQYRIAPGDEIEFVPAGDVIQLIPPSGESRLRIGAEERLRLFDAASDRQREREQQMPLDRSGQGKQRDWKREDLYTRGPSR